MSISYEGLESRLAEVEGEIERMQEAIEKLEAEKEKLGRWMEMFRTEELPVLSAAKPKNRSKGGWDKLTDKQKAARLEKLRLARESKKAKALAKPKASVPALSMDSVLVLRYDDLVEEIDEE